MKFPPIAIPKSGTKMCEKEPPNHAHIRIPCQVNVRHSSVESTQFLKITLLKHISFLFFFLHDVIFTKSTYQCTNSLAHLLTYYLTFLAAKRTIFTLNVHSWNSNEVKHVKAYIRYDKIWKMIILVKKWVNVFHTCNYISVAKYEVWLHLRKIYANTDEIGIHKTKKIKTFQSKNTKFLKITVFQYFNSDFANSEHKHKHKHKRKSLFKISAAWPSFTLNTTWFQPCLQHFTVQTTCLSFNI